MSEGWVTETQGDSPSRPGQRVGAGGPGTQGGGRRRSGRGQRGPVSSVKVKPKVKPGEQATEEGGGMAVRGCAPAGGCRKGPRQAARTRSRGAGSRLPAQGTKVGGSRVPACPPSSGWAVHSVPPPSGPHSTLSPQGRPHAAAGWRWRRGRCFVVSLTAESKSSRLAPRGRSRTVTKWLRK